MKYKVRRAICTRKSRETPRFTRMAPWLKVLYTERAVNKETAAILAANKKP